MGAADVLTAADHRSIREATKSARNTAAQERRANGWGYRKVPITVVLLDLRAAVGKWLASSDVKSEHGRWFEMEPNGTRWTCSCGLYRSCGACHHTAHMVARRTALFAGAAPLPPGAAPTHVVEGALQQDGAEQHQHAKEERIHRPSQSTRRPATLAGGARAAGPLARVRRGGPDGGPAADGPAVSPDGALLPRSALADGAPAAPEPIEGGVGAEQVDAERLGHLRAGERPALAKQRQDAHVQLRAGLGFGHGRGPLGPLQQAASAAESLAQHDQGMHADVGEQQPDDPAGHGVGQNVHGAAQRRGRAAADADRGAR